MRLLHIQKLVPSTIKSDSVATLKNLQRDGQSMDIQHAQTRLVIQGYTAWPG